MSMNFQVLSTLLAAAAIALTASCGSSNDETLPDNPNNPVLAANATDVVLDSARPRFEWPAVDGAEGYHLVVSDDEGNGYSSRIDAIDSNCNSGTCNTVLQPAYHAGDLTWTVQATGPAVAESLPVGGDFTTPASTVINPITSDPDDCEVWPAVAYGDFVVLNNIWGARAMDTTNWHQTISLEQNKNKFIANWDYDWLNETDGKPVDVKAYPEVIYGNKLGTHVSAPKSRTGLPSTVTELSDYYVDFRFSETGDAERNVALESFFHDTCTITGPCDIGDGNRAYEMMIWVANPTLRRPSSILAESGVLIDGRRWDVWTKPGQDLPYIAFTAQEDFSEGTLHWNAFVNWTMQWTGNPDNNTGLDPLLAEHCMAAIELGTELWWGQGSFRLEEYSVRVN